MSAGEEWRSIPGFVAYEVSSLGRVRRVVELPRCRWTPGLLNPWPDRDGYYQVSLSRNGKSVKRRIHLLVCIAFHGPRPDGMEVCHNDGSRTNNAASNLRWDTRSANIADAFRHGTRFRLTHCRRGLHELTPENVYLSKGGTGRSCKPCSRAAARRTVA